jgi:hypothetical protein
MARPLSFLILALAVGCVALFVLLPMSKITEHRVKAEAQSTNLPAGAQVSEQTTTRHNDILPTDSGAIDSSEHLEVEEYTLPISGRVGNRSGAAPRH